MKEKSKAELSAFIEWLDVNLSNQNEKGEEYENLVLRLEKALTFVEKLHMPIIKLSSDEFAKLEQYVAIEEIFSDGNCDEFSLYKVENFGEEFCVLVTDNSKRFCYDGNTVEIYAVFDSKLRVKKSICKYDVIDYIEQTICKFEIVLDLAENADQIICELDVLKENLYGVDEIKYPRKKSISGRVLKCYYGNFVEFWICSIKNRRVMNLIMTNLSI